MKFDGSLKDQLICHTRTIVIWVVAAQAAPLRVVKGRPCPRVGVTSAGGASSRKPTCGSCTHRRRPYKRPAHGQSSIQVACRERSPLLAAYPQVATPIHKQFAHRCYKNT
ncbi:hypothetical protein BHE74_00027104 [Ensete ventricosum]|nr:hypothetical protein BHE74_00027104 [Ensete ventricosum]RZR90507.1 hypothetical protein BHM03_00018413 [Ensete ventricosum]